MGTTKAIILAGLGKKLMVRGDSTASFGAQLCWLLILSLMVGSLMDGSHHRAAALNLQYELDVSNHVLSSTFQIHRTRVVGGEHVRTFELAVLDTHVDLPLHVSVGGSMGAQKIPFADLWAGNMSSSALDGAVQLHCHNEHFDHTYVSRGPDDRTSSSRSWWSDALIPMTRFRSDPVLGQLTRLQFPIGDRGFHVDANRFSALLLLAEWDDDGRLLHDAMPTDALRNCQLKLVRSGNHSFVSNAFGKAIEVFTNMTAADPLCASTTVVEMDGSIDSEASAPVRSVPSRFCHEEVLFNNSFLQTVDHIKSNLKVIPLIWAPTVSGSAKSAGTIMKGTVSEMVGMQVGPHATHQVASEVGALASSDLTNAVATNVSMLLPDALTQALSESVAEHLLDFTVDSVTSAIWQPLVPDIVTPLRLSLARIIPRVIDKTFPKLMARSLSVTVTNLLTRSVTHAVTSTLGQALMNDKDHKAHCHSCFYHNIGCNYCKYSQEGAYYAIYAADYYSDWYGDYYADYYTHAMDAVIVKQIKKDRALVRPSKMRVPETEMGEWGGGFSADR